jgi:SagB-type dehydrogenase family enzyme
MNKKPLLCITALLILSLASCASPTNANKGTEVDTREADISLPEPKRESEKSIEEALIERRSVREYEDAALSLSEIGQLLWAAQGITSERGFRTAPSAGALYPLELYLVVGDVEQLPPGVYKYKPDMHRLINTAQGDLRDELQAASLDQSAIGDAPAVIVIAAVYERTTVKYGDRGNRYVHMEVGSAVQNVYLQAVSLDLGTVIIGAFHDQNIKSLLHMQENEHPLAIMPVGRK